MKTTTRKQPDLSIVIPAYCEERRIGNTLDELAVFLKNDKFFASKHVEVIVVAADTTDKTHQIVRSKQKMFANLYLLKPGPKVGKGRDVRYGMLCANGCYILFMDADLATPLHHIKDFYKSCLQGSDIVVGTRDLTKHHPGLLRRTISRIGNILFRIAGGVWIEDSQCGFKMFNSSASKLCFSRLTILSWGFDMEVLTIAKVHKLNMKSIRINDWTDKPYSTFTDNVLKVSVRSLFELTKIFINRVGSRYK